MTLERLTVDDVVAGLRSMGVGEPAIRRWLAAQGAPAPERPRGKGVTATQPPEAVKQAVERESGAFVVTLPLPENRGNARHGTWHERHRSWESYRQRCAHLRPPYPEPLTRARLTADVRVGALMDWDNLWARLKHPLDALVSLGWLADDSPRVIPTQPTVTQRTAPAPERGITITITPVSAP